MLTGVSHLAVYTSDSARSEFYYEHDLGGVKGEDAENPAGVRYYFSPKQFVEVLPKPPGESVNLLDHVAFTTADAEAMRQYLGGLGASVPKRVSTGKDGSRWFTVSDPEGHRIEFVQPPPAPPSVAVNTLSNRILHVGFIVHNVDLEDDFFVNKLGFRVYWHGGLTPDKTLWVWRQLPDSRDWLEYMVAAPADGRGIPSDMTQEAAGVMNHFALGVHNVEGAYTMLWHDGRLQNQHNNTLLSRPMLGHDAKWEVSLFDPDGTRTELIEFHAVGKACCSPVTAAEPDE